jgi:hypothetical protein
MLVWDICALNPDIAPATPPKNVLKIDVGKPHHLSKTAAKIVRVHNIS